MEIDLAVLADAANVTTDSKINIFGIFRTIMGPELPLKPPPFFLVFTMLPAREDLGFSYDFRVVFEDSNGATVLPIGNGRINVPRLSEYNYPMFNVLIGIGNLQVPEYGTYFFNIIIGDRPVRKVPLVASPINIQTNLLNPPV